MQSLVLYLLAFLPQPIQDQSLRAVGEIQQAFSNMPLVVPGITSSNKDSSSGSGGSVQDWQNKLLGKKIGEQHDEVSFARQDLPSDHRVLGPDSMATMDWKPERLNVHTDSEGVVKDVKFG